MFTHHKFEGIEMELHPDIAETYDRVKKVLGEFAEKEKKEMPVIVIGGGCLSDTYMGREFRDIDVFIQYERWMRGYEEKIAERLQTKIEKINQGPNVYEHFDMFMMGKPKVENQKTELLFCVDIDCVYDFDFRFRQFYLYEDQVYVTKGALQDIKEKKLVLESPTTPFTTFVRGMRFEETLGFSWEEQSYRELQWFLSHVEVDEYMINKIKQNPKYSNQIVTKLQEHVKMFESERENWFKFPESPSVFSPEVEEFLKKREMCVGGKKLFQSEETSKLALLYSDLKNYKSKNGYKKEIYEIQLEEKEVEILFSFLVKEWASFYQTSRLVYLHNGEMPKEVFSVYQKWGKLARENKQKELYQFILMQEKKIVEHLLYEYDEWLYNKLGKFNIEFKDIFNVCMKKKVSLEKEEGMFIQFDESDFRNHKERYMVHFQNTFHFSVNENREVEMEWENRTKEKEKLYMVYNIIFEKIRKNEMTKMEFNKNKMFESNNYGAKPMYIDQDSLPF